MKKLYHFTSRDHLHGIGRYGLTVGDVPTDIDRCEGQCGVWLTSDDAPAGHGLEFSAVNKKRYRLTVGVAEDDSALIKWTDFAAKNATPATIRSLHSSGGAFDSWYVYFAVIDAPKIEECIDMETGLAVEGWRDMPEGAARPVPSYA